MKIHAAVLEIFTCLLVTNRQTDRTDRQTDRQTGRQTPDMPIQDFLPM